MPYEIASCDTIWGMSEHEPGYGSVVELGDKPAQELTRIFGNQLRRLARLRRTNEKELNPLGVRLLDKVIVARIRDLNGLGCGKQASQIINPPETPKG